MSCMHDGLPACSLNTMTLACSFCSCLSKFEKFFYAERERGRTRACTDTHAGRHFGKAKGQIYVYTFALTHARAHYQASEELRNNQELVMVAVSKKGRALKFASDKLKVRSLDSEVCVLVPCMHDA